MNDNKIITTEDGEEINLTALEREFGSHAKIWCLESPDGEKVTARNLKVYMIDRYGEEEGKRVYGLLTCAAARFRKCGHGSGAGWRVLAVPALPGE